MVAPAARRAFSITSAADFSGSKDDLTRAWPRTRRSFRTTALVVREPTSHPAVIMT